jgi:hypothetical protein
MKLPAAGSTTRSPGDVIASINALMSPMGLMCGCSVRSTFSGQRSGIVGFVRHVARALIGAFCSATK